MTIKRIYMFASFGDLSQPHAGGGQNSARRLRKTLESMGIEVIIFNRHWNHKSFSIFDSIRKYIFLIVDIILWGCFLLFKKRKYSPILFLSYSGKLLPFDFAIGLISKILGYKIIYYLKGGGIYSSYQKRGFLFKSLFKMTLNIFDEVMGEGEKTLTLVNQCSNVRTCYLPNYIENEFTPSSFPKRDTDVINLIFFGRIDENKNILLIIDIFDLLCEKYSNIRLQLIGSGSNNYESLVHLRIKQSSFQNYISWIPKASHDEIKKILPHQHFFIFPSSERQEGHSNALNEAMAWGLIPIVSNHNFLPELVKDSFLVANDYEASSFVSIISYIIDNNKIPYFSEMMYNIVKDNYTENNIMKKLDNELNIFFHTNVSK